MHDNFPDSETPTDDGVIIIAGRRYLTTAGLMRMLGVCHRTLLRWHDARVGPPRIKIGTKVLYDESKLTEWLAAFETQPLDRRRRPTRAA